MRRSPDSARQRLKQTAQVRCVAAPGWGTPDGAFTGLVKDAWIDREARKGKVPSDHAPVIVDLNA